MKDEYTLEELIKTLEVIKKNDSGPFNFPKAIYCLAKEIKKLKTKKVKNE
jgi:hypothetical protein